jgi:hypothetical protein
MMTGPVLRAGAWPTVAGVSGVAVVVGGCGAAFPAAATVLALVFPLVLGARWSRWRSGTGAETSGCASR